MRQRTRIALAIREQGLDPSIPYVMGKNGMLVPKFRKDMKEIAAEAAPEILATPEVSQAAQQAVAEVVTSATRPEVPEVKTETSVIEMPPQTKPKRKPFQKKNESGIKPE